jgi:hypothetical protein
MRSFSCWTKASTRWWTCFALWTWTVRWMSDCWRGGNRNICLIEQTTCSCHTQSLTWARMRRMQVMAQSSCQNCTVPSASSAWMPLRSKPLPSSGCWCGWLNSLLAVSAIFMRHGAGIDAPQTCALDTVLTAFSVVGCRRRWDGVHRRVLRAYAPCAARPSRCGQGSAARDGEQALRRERSGKGKA